MKKDVFGFLKNIFSDTSNDYDYLHKINDSDFYDMLKCFFERSVIEIVPQKELLKLVKYINHDIKNNTFNYEEREKTFRHVMNEKQLKSKTHRAFLDIVKNYFGHSAYELLSERKNLNVFNLSEIHVLHQDIFDTFGEKFVNRILNNDLTPESLIIIKDILTDKEAKLDFKYFYDFYNEHIGDSQVDFEKMIRGFDHYRALINNIRTNKIKLTEKQISTMKEIFSDIKNEYKVINIDGVNEFYNNKNKKYQYYKNVAQNHLDNIRLSEAFTTLASGFFKNYFSMDYNPDTKGYTIATNNAAVVSRYIDIKGILKNRDTLGSSFSDEEIELLQDLQAVVDMCDRANTSDYLSLLEMCKKYEEKGNEMSTHCLNLLKKLPEIYKKDMLNSLSRVEELERRAMSEEKGIYIDNSARTNSNSKINQPVYVLDGADFAFLSTTIYKNGLSGHKVGNDYAKSWFEYENGTSHVCCSYSDQDNLVNMEFNNYNSWRESSDKVTYLFDDGEIFTMGATDIYTPSEARVSNVYSNGATQFTKAAKVAEMTSDFMGDYNEVALNRFNYNTEKIKKGGKIIPSAIMCADQVSDFAIQIAESFTKYCIEHGLKPEGWKMPLVVVKTNNYYEIQNEKRKKLIDKNSEYFIEHEVSEKEKKFKEEIKKQQVNNTDQTVSHTSGR